jgi:hypothetical protein
VGEKGYKVVLETMREKLNAIENKAQTGLKNLQDL